ncbi:MAG: acyl-CoA dehydrogenase family protein [Caldimonas sp.]
MPDPSQRAAALVDALRADATETDREGDYPERSMALLHEAGLLSAPVPAVAGGESLGDAARTLELLDTLAQIGRGNLVVGRLYEGHVNALLLIERYGNPAQRLRWAADAIAGRLFGVWNTEAAGGVTLHEDRRGWRLEGAKTFASGCGHVERALVTGERDGGGWQMLIVDTAAQPPQEDRQFWQPLGMRASASFKAGFDGTRVDASDLLGAVGDYYREPQFSGGAVRFAAVQQGGIEAVFDETRRFLSRLGRTDDAFQRLRAGEMAMAVEAGRLWLRGAADSATIHATQPAQQVAYAGLMRSAIEASALQVLRLAERSVGARGLLRPEIFERLHRDLTHYLRQPAPDAVLVNAGAYALADAAPASQLWSSPPSPRTGDA